MSPAEDEGVRIFRRREVENLVNCAYSERETKCNKEQKTGHNAELNKNYSKSPTGVDCSSLAYCGTQEHAHSESPHSLGF